jgi:signal transduction histidine kinase
MGAYIRTINAFIEDTCVIVVLAYLLTRGRLLTLLVQKRSPHPKAGLLGLILGAIGLTEVIFPGARFPYVTHTLIVTFAALNGGLRASLITAGVVAAGAALFQSPEMVAGLIPALVASALLGEAVRRTIGVRHRLIGGWGAGMLAQAATLLIRAWFAGSEHHRFSISHALISIPANGFGVMLLQLVANDALVRASSERHRLEAERARALLMEAELTALRARVHPHFLFNTLSAIAGLCGVAPDRAETAILRLSQLMRRVLEAHPTTPLPLAEELDAVRAYLDIEQDRLGPRLQVVWDVDPACECAQVPPFALQTLVENATEHGIAPKLGPGSVTIIVRRYPRHALIAVADDGVGIARDTRHGTPGPDGARLHGLQILAQQLVLLYGRPARPRFLSRVDEGTRALFIVPIEEHAARSTQHAA